MSTPSSTPTNNKSASPPCRYSNSTIAVGIDLGSANARIGTYDTNLNHPVICANHDGHRETKVMWCEAASTDGGDDDYRPPETPVTTAEQLKGFFEERLLGLATSTAHTKDLAVVTSIPNDHEDTASTIDGKWLETLQSFGSVITEAAAICVAYQVDPSIHRRVLVLDGGASSLKGTILVAASHGNINNGNAPTTSNACGGGGLWIQEHFAKLDTVNGPSLVEPLAQSVAQQFEQNHRFPRGEVWQSKKARAKLLKACEASLSSFQRLPNVSIHVDGLYEGMDCNVSMSKVKWEHLSSKFANQVKAFCQKELLLLQPSGATIDTVLVAGNMHDWMMPIVKSTVGADKLHPATGSLDPAEAIAMGCTMQSYWNLQHHLNGGSGGGTFTAPPKNPTLSVPCCPVAIGVEGGGAENEDTPTIWIAQGTPLPCQVSHSVQTKTGVLELLQLHPQKKALAKLEELDATVATTISLQLSVQGRLRIQFNNKNGESIVIG